MDEGAKESETMPLIILQYADQTQAYIASAGIALHGKQRIAHTT